MDATPTTYALVCLLCIEVAIAAYQIHISYRLSKIEKSTATIIKKIDFIYEKLLKANVI